MSQAARLYTFTVSHFCEKARWGLDRAGVPYREVVLLPGLHRRPLRGLGAGKHVPVLTIGDRVVQGSSAILDFADARGIAPPLLPSEPGLREEVLEWERYLDRDVGETLRRVLYFHVLKRRGALVSAWSRGGPFWAPALYWLMWPGVVATLKRYLDLEPDSVRRDERVLLRAFERLEGRLAARSFLVGDSFSRADLTLAALCSPLLRPSEHPWPAPAALERDPEVAELAQRLRASVTGQRIAAAYARRREDPVLGRCLGSVVSV
jgi:glutathione S-transferase